MVEYLPILGIVVSIVLAFRGVRWFARYVVKWPPEA